MQSFRRSMSTLGMMASTTSSPFTRTVVAAVKKLYPEKLADKSFDNTGLLLEAPHRPGNSKPSVLLAIDLTRGVAEEAIAKKASIIVAYHPIIFRALKSFTLANTQQTSLLRLAQEGISVYCPHTAVDAAPGGLNDWLSDIVTGSLKDSRFLIQPDEACSYTKDVIIPVDSAEGLEGAGYGRIVRFQKPQKLGLLIKRITKGLAIPGSGISLAVPQSVSSDTKLDLEISSIGICAGSGGHMLGNLDVDLLFTGELSHHEALAAIENGKVVITAFHSNTERGFLRQVMQKKIQDGILSELTASSSKVTYQIDASSVEVLVSDVDRDPFEILICN